VSHRISLLLLVVMLSACSMRDVSCGLPPPPEATAPDVIAGGAAEAQTTFRIAFLGDSLTSGLGLLSDRAFPARVEAMFAAEGFPEIESVNGGVSGDTSAGGLRRVEQLLDGSTRILVVALGANDALRGLSVQQTRENLSQIIEVALARGAGVLLCGMEAPVNLGDDYRASFRQVYVDLLRQYQGRISFMPFLLEGVAGDPALNQADGVHPTEEGAQLIALAMYPRLRAMVDQMGIGN
jgi:acyl-CoA thioesterase I